MTVGRQIDEVFRQHRKLNNVEAKRASIELLKKVGVPSPEKRYYDFPHQLSGGMRQRVLIAMAFACEPDLIIADEPTTALDVTIQAQILDLLMEFKRNNNMSMLLITHDLSIVANMADDIYVMYSGKIVERGSAQQIFKNPLHPYTIGLLKSVPRLSDTFEGFIQIPDTIPNPMMKPKGCYFHPRCEIAEDRCRKCMPELKTLDGDRGIRCWNYNKNKHLEI
jgi:oligopeptide/dipeptide ABC transporter ATP-binding protein